MNLYVSNLSFGFQNEDLRAIFAPLGIVTSAEIILNKLTNQSRGFGFVVMTDSAASKKAITELNGTLIEGRPIAIMEMKPTETRSE